MCRRSGCQPGPQAQRRRGRCRPLACQAPCQRAGSVLLPHAAGAMHSHRTTLGAVAPADVTDAMLHAAFQACPGCSDARVMWDHATGRSRGYGFVSFRQREEAEAAIQVRTHAPRPRRPCAALCSPPVLPRCWAPQRATARGSSRDFEPANPAAAAPTVSMRLPGPGPTAGDARPVHRCAACALRLGAAQDRGHRDHGPAGWGGGRGQGRAVDEQHKTGAAAGADPITLASSCGPPPGRRLAKQLAARWCRRRAHTSSLRCLLVRRARATTTAPGATPRH